jgi:spore photoproduct lyase
LPISRIYIDHDAANSPVVDKVLSLVGAPVEYIKDANTVYNLLRSAADPVQKGKQILYLTRNKGAFVRDCPV